MLGRFAVAGPRLTAAEIKLDLHDSRRHQDGEQYAGVGGAGGDNQPQSEPRRRAQGFSALKEIGGAVGASAVQVIALMCFSNRHCTLQALFSLLSAIFPLVSLGFKSTFIENLEC